MQTHDPWKLLRWSTATGCLTLACLITDDETETPGRSAPPGSAGQQPTVEVQEGVAQPSSARNEKLTIEQIRAGVEPTKAPAIECGRAHDAPPGTTIQVKLEIDGASGDVTRARVSGRFADTELGACIESVASQAHFAQFGAVSLAIVFPYRL